MYTFENKLVFIAHPRMASRSISEVLLRGGAVKWNDEHHPVDQEKIELVQNAGGTVASVYRSMFDVLVSWFCRSRRHTLAVGHVEKVAPKKEFENWLKIVTINEGHQYLDPPIYHYGLRESNYWIPFEFLLESVENLMLRTDMEPQEIFHRGKSNRVGYVEYYTPEARKIVESRWSKDLHITQCRFGD